MGGGVGKHKLPHRAVHGRLQRGGVSLGGIAALRLLKMLVYGVLRLAVLRVPEHKHVGHNAVFRLVGQLVVNLVQQRLIAVHRRVGNRNAVLRGREQLGRPQLLGVGGVRHVQIFHAIPHGIGGCIDECEDVLRRVGDQLHAGAGDLREIVFAVLGNQHRLEGVGLAHLAHARGGAGKLVPLRVLVVQGVADILTRVHLGVQRIIAGDLHAKAERALNALRVLVIPAKEHIAHRVKRRGLELRAIGKRRIRGKRKLTLKLRGRIRVVYFALLRDPLGVQQQVAIRHGGTPRILGAIQAVLSGVPAAKLYADLPRILGGHIAGVWHEVLVILILGNGCAIVHAGRCGISAGGLVVVYDVVRF